MRFIEARTHGIVDYLMGILLIVAPWLLGFADGGAAQWVPVILGLGTIVYSICTDYELGMARMISVKTHLGIDLVAEIFLAASPLDFWVFRSGLSTTFNFGNRRNWNEFDDQARTCL